MRMCRLILLLLSCAFALSSCSATLQPENQAFAMTMSVDLVNDTNLMEIGVVVPTLSGAASDGGGEEPNYVRYYATAETFDACLNMLQTVMPLTLNLSQLKSVVVSQSLARTDRFRELIEDMMLTNHLYNTTYLAVSVSSARTVLENLKPLVAGRLSMELDAAYEHYGEVGYVPLTRLGDMYYHMASIYGEPFCLLVATAGDEMPRMALPEGELGAALPGALPALSTSKNQYLGSALFRDGRMVGVMDGQKTRWARVIAGEINNFAYHAEGKTLRLLVRGKPRIGIDTRGDAPRISIEIGIVPVPQREMPDMRVLNAAVRAEIMDMLMHLKSLGVDPINFGALAAARFATVDAFERYGWPDRMEDAEFELGIVWHDAYTL